MEGGQHALLPPVPAPQAFAPARSRALCSGAAASTSGRTSAAAPVVLHYGLLSHLYRHSVETDAIIRVENERLRAGLQEARRRHVRAAVSAASRRLRDAEADLQRSLRRNAELEQRVQEMVAEAQAWQGVAKSHEAVAAGLRSQLLQPEGEGEGEAEDARSCCFGEDRDRAVDHGDGTARALHVLLS